MRVLVTGPSGQMGTNLVPQLVQHLQHALDNMIMTFSGLGRCHQSRTPIIVSSSRGVYGEIHRFSTMERMSC